MIRMQIQLTEGQAAKLRGLAADRRISMAALVRHAVDRLLAEPGPTLDERWERAMALAGRYRSGHTDVSERHDEHLLEAYSSHVHRNDPR